MAKSKLAIAIAAAAAAVSTANAAQAEEVTAEVVTPEITETVVEAETKTVEAGTEIVETTTENIEAARATQADLVAQANSAGVANWQNEAIEVATEEEALAQIEADNARIQAAIEVAEHAKAEHAKAVEEYNAAVAAQEAKTHEEGQLKEAVGQNLVFEQGANADAKMEIQAPTMSVEEVKSYLTEVGREDQGYLASRDWLGDGEFAEIPSDSYLTVKYTGVNGANKGVKFSHVEYQYRVLNDNEKVISKFFKDPNRGFDFFSLNRDLEIEVIITAYDTEGNQVSLKDAVFNLGSLNAGKDSQEAAKLKTGRLVEINGSTIAAHGEYGYSDTDNDEETLGYLWDGFGMEKAYKGAIAGLNNEDKAVIIVRSSNRGTHWFTIDSNVPVRDLPVYPVLDLGHVCYTPVKLMAEVKKTAEIPGQVILRSKPELIISFDIPEEFPTADKPELVIEPETAPETPVTEFKAQPGTIAPQEVKTQPEAYESVSEASQNQLPSTGDDINRGEMVLAALCGMIGAFFAGVMVGERKK